MHQGVGGRELLDGMGSDLPGWTATDSLELAMLDAAPRQPNPKALEDRHGDIAQQSDLSDPVWSRITVQDIRDALEVIEQPYRDVFALHTFEHLSYEQIAERLSIQRITVGTRLNRARKKLREVLVKRFGLKDEP